MNFLGLLAVKVSTFAPLAIDSKLNFIGKYIEWLISVTGSVGLGIVLFTLTLRLIVLPFDVYSKIKTKTNALKMEEMRPELERLQKQYANDKNLYNQKMLALQKKNGYSPLSGCLPMILSLIIFIIAINAFRTYSAISMVNEYNDILAHYNAAVKELTVDKSGTVFEENDGEVIIKDLPFYSDIEVIFPDYSGIKSVLKINGDALELAIDENGVFQSEGAKEFIDKIKEKAEFVNYYNYFAPDGDTYKLDYLTVTDDEEKRAKRTDIVGAIISISENAYISEVVEKNVNASVKEAYESGEIMTSRFLWVKNVWMSDVSYEHPITPDASNFASKVSAAARRSCSCSAVDIGVDKPTYDKVTAGLDAQKNQANGYFIMVALSILSMFFSQFIITRMQKAQLELQTQDGQAAATQKMMMWMMPIMFGVFAFSYSTAFSIYMTVSSVSTTVSTIIINVILDKKFAAKKAEIKDGRSKKDINRIEKEKEAAEEEKKKKEAEKELKKAEKNKKKEK